MRRLKTHPAALVITIVSLVAIGFSNLTTARGDEGMWLFNQPPRKLLMERYGFDPTDQWLNHLQHAAVRFNSGGSGSFVSGKGLVMTNHHVGADALHKLSTPQRDLVTEGHLAATPADELKCVDLELNVLMTIEDITERVNAAVKPDMSAAEAHAARVAVSNTIEKESLDKTGLRSDVVTLFQGGRVQPLLLQEVHRRAAGVRAGERHRVLWRRPRQFRIPTLRSRYLLLPRLRRRQAGRTAALSLLEQGRRQDEELIFVAGNPGHTDRLNTVAHLQFLRDTVFPELLNLIRRREIMLQNYSERGLENERRARDELFGYQNSRKARLGGLAGLQDPSIMDAKRKDERSLRQAIDEDPKLRDARGAWDQVSTALAAWHPIYIDYSLYERGTAFNTELYRIARGLVRLGEESTKPNADRLPEYAEAGLESLKQQLFSTAPIYPDLEIAKLTDSLGYLLERGGSENALVKEVMANMSPAGRAAELINGSKLADVKVRKQLAEGGKSAIEASDDPMIALARLVDPPARKLRTTYENNVEEPLRQAYAKIARSRFAIEGESTYPDATFTLRLAFGQVKGYTDQGRKMPPWTTIAGAYPHAAEHGDLPPFKLPERWVKGKDKLDLRTPFNFVSTADIIGGNSGSPVVNRAGEIVGIIFDGNIQSLVLDFVYSDKEARAISVHSSVITEAMRKLYGAEKLADELTGK